MKKLRLRAVISSVLILCWLLMALTGAVLYFSQTGSFGGIPRLYIKNAHSLGGFLMFLAVVPHLLLNLRSYRAELRAWKRQKSDGD